MSSKSVLYSTLVLAIVTATMYFMGMSLYLFWVYWWYDVLMHFLVPLTGGFGIYWGLFHSGLIFRQRFESRALTIIFVFVCVMVIGVGWEVYEYAFDITDSHEGYMADTVNDLLLDSSGALLAVVLASKKKNHG